MWGLFRYTVLAYTRAAALCSQLTVAYHANCHYLLYTHSYLAFIWKTVRCNLTVQHLFFCWACDLALHIFPCSAFSHLLTYKNLSLYEVEQFIIVVQARQLYETSLVLVTQIKVKNCSCLECLEHITFDNFPLLENKTVYKIKKSLLMYLEELHNRTFRCV